MVLCENNMKSLDIRTREAAVRFVRGLVKGNRDITVNKTPAGLEVWHQTDSGGLLVRKANIDFLVDFLRKRGINLVERRAAMFSEAYVNLPFHALKKIVYWMNEVYFRMRLPPGIAIGNILILRKA